MGFSVKKKGEREYLYFYLGSEGPYYLAPKDNPKDSNIGNVLKALSYVSEKNQDFTQDEIKLIDMLPLLPKDQYVSKRLVELDKNLELTFKQLSETEQKEYLQRRVAAFQTRLRRLEPIPEITTEEIAEISHNTLSKAAVASPTSRKQFNKRLKKIKKKKTEESDDDNGKS